MYVSEPFDTDNFVKIYYSLLQKNIIYPIVDAWSTITNRKKEKYIFVSKKINKSLCDYLSDPNRSAKEIIETTFNAITLIHNMHKLGVVISFANYGKYRRFEKCWFGYDEKNKMYLTNIHYFDYYYNHPGEYKMPAFIFDYFLLYSFLENINYADTNSNTKNYNYLFILGYIKKNICEALRNHYFKFEPEFNIPFDEWITFEQNVLEEYKKSIPHMKNIIVYKENEGIYISKEDDGCSSDKWQLDMSKSSEINGEKTSIFFNSTLLRKIERENGEISFFRACKKEKCGIIKNEFEKCSDCTYLFRIIDCPLESIEYLKKLQIMYQYCSRQHLTLSVEDSWICENRKKLVIITADYNISLYHYFKKEGIGIIQKICALHKMMDLVSSYHNSLIICKKIHEETFFTNEKNRLIIMDLEDMELLNNRTYISRNHMMDMVDDFIFLIDMVLRWLREANSFVKSWDEFAMFCHKKIPNKLKTLIGTDTYVSLDQYMRYEAIAMDEFEDELSHFL